MAQPQAGTGPATCLQLLSAGRKRCCSAHRQPACCCCHGDFCSGCCLPGAAAAGKQAKLLLLLLWLLSRWSCCCAAVTLLDGTSAVMGALAGMFCSVMSSVFSSLIQLQRHNQQYTIYIRSMCGIETAAPHAGVAASTTAGSRAGQQGLWSVDSLANSMSSNIRPPIKSTSPQLR